MYDIIPIAEGGFLNNIKNSLNSLNFGFGIPDEQIKIVAALHCPANMLNYDYQDTSIQVLQYQCVKMLSCHTALAKQVPVLIVQIT